MKNYKKFKLVALGIVALCVTVEVGVRASGMIDFPLYTIDKDLGYLINPNQTGTFLKNHDWYFNDKSMGVAQTWHATEKTDVLLLGNSIIFGGNPYMQSQKIGPLVQNKLRSNFSVWPAATGGWTAINEMNYLEKNKDVLNGTDVLVWQYMAGGLSQLSQWRGEYVFPTQKPIWATGYLFQRYVLPKLNLGKLPSELPPTGEIDAVQLQRFNKMLATVGANKKGIILLYPDQKQNSLGNDAVTWLPEYKQISNIAKENGFALLDVSKDDRWKGAIYRDGVHPTVEGNQILSAIIVKAVLKTVQATDKVK